MTPSVRRQCRVIFALASASAWIWAAPALAQMAPTTAPTQTVDVIADLIYDSNVTGSSGALSASRGLNREDILYNPSIVFDVARPLGLGSVFLQGSAGFDFHLRNHILNRENIDLHPGFTTRLSRCQTTLTSALVRAQSDLSELSLTPGGLPVRVGVANVVTSENVALSADCGRQVGFAPNLSLSQTWSQNSDPVQRFADANSFSASGGLAYRRPVLGSLSLFGSYARSAYPLITPLFLVPGPPRGYETIALGGTYVRAVGTRLQGSVSVSYTKLMPFSGFGGYSGLTYSGSVSYRATNRLDGEVSASRSTTPSMRLNSSYGVDELFSGKVNYRLGRRLTFAAGGSYGHNRYNGVPYPVGFDLTDERLTTVFANADFTLVRGVLLGLNVLHSQRDANFPGLSYPETRAGFSVKTIF